MIVLSSLKTHRGWLFLKQNLVHVFDFFVPCRNYAKMHASCTMRSHAYYYIIYFLFFSLHKNIILNSICLSYWQIVNVNNILRKWIILVVVLTKPNEIGQVSPLLHSSNRYHSNNITVLITYTSSVNFKLVQNEPMIFLEYIVLNYKILVHIIYINFI